MHGAVVAPAMWRLMRSLRMSPGRQCGALDGRRQPTSRPGRTRADPQSTEAVEEPLSAHCNFYPRSAGFLRCGALECHDCSWTCGGEKKLGAVVAAPKL